MTAVMRFAFEKKYPIIFGDLLLSGPKSNKEVHIPTSKDIVDLFPNGSERVPVGLKQKIVIISDNLVIGWSGNYLTAKDIMQDLYLRSKDKPFTKNSIDKYFSNLYQSAWEQDVSFLGFIKDEKGIANIGYRYLPLMTKSHGKIGFVGTGSRTLDKLLHQITQEPKVLNGNPNILEFAVSYTLSLTGVLLTNELSTQNSLRNFFGGGYEIASFVEGKFQKVDNVSYLFWSARKTGDEIFISNTPLYLINFSYIDDILTIRSVSFDNSNTNMSIEQSGYGVLPMYRAVPKSELDSLELPDLNMKWHCNYFLVTPPSGEIEIFARIDYRAKIDRCVKFIEDGDKVIVAVEKEFIKNVAESICNHFR